MSEAFPEGMSGEADAGILQAISQNIDPTFSAYLQDLTGVSDPFLNSLPEEKKSNLIEDSNISSLETTERLQYIKSALLSMGYQGLGNLNSTDPLEIKKTVECVYSLVRQCQILMEQKKKHNEIVFLILADYSIF